MHNAGNSLTDNSGKGLTPLQKLFLNQVLQKLYKYLIRWQSFVKN